MCSVEHKTLQHKLPLTVPTSFRSFVCVESLRIVWAMVGSETFQPAGSHQQLGFRVWGLRV